MPTRTRQTPKRSPLCRRTTGLVAGLVAVVGASGSATVGSHRGDPESASSVDEEWVEIIYGAGTRVDVAVFKPEAYSDSGNHPLILALPWGGGTPDLTLGMVDAYWKREASRREYVVVAPSTGR